MLHQSPTTIPAENRDYPEWHRGRLTYAVWILSMEDGIIVERFNAARQHLSGYLLEPYRRQPHVTLFVCGFLVDEPQHNDDFTPTQLQSQFQALQEARIEPFEIEVSGLNSFASAPFLEVSDPRGGITRLRDVLARGAREFRTAPYTPHLTVGLYSSAFPSADVANRLATFPARPTHLKIEQIAFTTYRAQEIAGPLTCEHTLVLNNGR